MRPADYFSDDAIRADLRGKTVRGGLYTGGQQVATFLVAFITVPILARILDPADYGLIAMSAVFTNFASMFVNAGLTSATVQRDRVTHEQSSNLFWIAVGVGALAAVVVCALSPAIAWGYDEERLVPITIGLSLPFLLGGLTVQHQSLLRRAMRFRQLAVIQVVAMAVAQAVGVAWAWNRRGQPDDYWALVAIPVTASAVLMIGVWVACSWRPGAPSRGVGTVSMLRFGANLTGANIMNYLVRSTDRMLLGWHSGEAPLGFYDRAHRLIIFPLSKVTTALSAVMVPALSRVAHDKQLLAKTHLRIVRILAATILPPMMSLTFTADWWIEVVLGPGWERAVPIFRWLTIAGLLLPLAVTVTWLYVAQDAAHKLFRWTAFETVTAIACYAIGLGWGPEGVAAAFSLCIVLIRFPGMVWWASRHGLIDTSGFLRELLNAVPPVAVIALLHALLRWVVPSTLGAGYGVLLSLLLLLAAMAGLGLVTPHGRRVVGEVREALRSVKTRKSDGV